LLVEQPEPNAMQNVPRSINFLPASSRNTATRIDPSHGTCMAALISGPDLGVFPRLNQLTVAMFAMLNDGTLLRAFYRIERSLTERREITHAIINLSVSISRNTLSQAYLDEFHSVLRRLADTGRVLFVMSAGNTGEVCQTLSKHE
jgi:subtilisin family serine protease